MNFTPEFWVQIFVYILGGFIFIAINAYKIGKLEERLVTKAELYEKVEERDKKIIAVHNHIDRVETQIKNEFVRKDLCGLSHGVLNAQGDKLEKQFADFRHDIRSMVQKVYDSNEFLKDSMHEFKEEIFKIVNTNK